MNRRAWLSPGLLLAAPVLFFAAFFLAPRRDADLATVPARAGRPISLGCDPGDLPTGLLHHRRMRDPGLPAGVVPGARSALAGLASLLRDPVGGAAVHQQHRARVRLDGAAGP
ncbi:hypothetical protein G6F24_017744 [Rhizopus arrhizus]|nr:hypothetical protein G6F24_017744 [Rhizopus arrhizus]